jgi:hypothetical protein
MTTWKGCFKVEEYLGDKMRARIERLGAGQFSLLWGVAQQV